MSEEPLDPSEPEPDTQDRPEGDTRFSRPDRRWQQRSEQALGQSTDEIQQAGHS